MKQQITIDQTKELGVKASKKLIEWALNHSPQNWQCRCPCKPPLLSIGQMIEFLDENKARKYSAINRREDYWQMGFIDYEFEVEIINKELCDILFEAVKEVLEK